MKRHFSSVSPPGDMLVVAIAPGLIIGLVLPSGRSSIAATELKLLPVALRPTNSATVFGVWTPHISEHERFRHTHDRQLDLRISSHGRQTPCVRHTDPEPFRVNSGERRIHM